MLNIILRQPKISFFIMHNADKMLPDILDEPLTCKNLNYPG